MKIQTFLGCSAAVLLSACGGSTVDDIIATRDIVQAMNDTYETLGVADPNTDDLPNAATFAVLPTTGSVDYSGFATVNVYDAVADETTFLALGFATIVANFDDQTITGSADNFVELDNPEATSFEDTTMQAIDGSLTYDFTQDNASSNAYSGTVTGTLTSTDTTVVNVNLNGTAEFIGTNAEGLNIDAEVDGLSSSVVATKN